MVGPAEPARDHGGARGVPGAAAGRLVREDWVLRKYGRAMLLLPDGNIVDTPHGGAGLGAGTRVGGVNPRRPSGSAGPTVAESARRGRCQTGKAACGARRPYRWWKGRAAIAENTRWGKGLLCMDERVRAAAAEELEDRRREVRADAERERERAAAEASAPARAEAVVARKGRRAAEVARREVEEERERGARRRAGRLELTWVSSAVKARNVVLRAGARESVPTGVEPGTCVAGGRAARATRLDAFCAARERRAPAEARRVRRRVRRVAAVPAAAVPGGVVAAGAEPSAEKMWLPFCVWWLFGSCAWLVE